MRYEAKVALRYLLSSKMQTALLIGGVEVVHSKGAAWRAGQGILDGTTPPTLVKLARISRYLNVEVRVLPDGTVRLVDPGT